MKKLFLMPMLLVCFLVSSCGSDNDNDPEVSNDLSGTWEVSDVYYEGDANIGEMYYQFIGQSVSFDDYIFVFNNDGTFTSSGAYTAELTMIMNGQEYTIEEAVPYSSVSGNYPIVEDILYFETASEEQEVEIIELSSNRMILNASGSAALTGGLEGIANVDVMEITLHKQ